MGKPSRREGREEAKARRKEAKKLSRRLREEKLAQGLSPPSKATRPNRTSPYETVTEEKEARTQTTLEQVRVIRSQLPLLLEKLAEIPDPRKPRSIVHKLTCLLLYGILGFVFQLPSRRKANEELSAPAMKEQLQRLFPELETLPHHDSLARLLGRIEVEGIEQAQFALVRDLVRDKKFARFTVQGKLRIAIDGSQKAVSNLLHSRQWLQRTVGDEKNKRPQYHVNVLEAEIVLSGGVRIPLASEFLDYSQGETAEDKQDCETRGFYRLAAKIKKAFPRLPILLLVDGLYATGPAMEVCHQYKWDYMIVLQDDSLPQVWREYEGLKRCLEPTDRLTWCRGDRQQSFHWVNGIEYFYGEGAKKTIVVHLVVCEEIWQEVDPQTAQIVTKRSRNVWISSVALSRDNVVCRCNEGGFCRWSIEEGFFVQKRCGYHYEHLYSYEWEAMRGYHLLMRLAELLNTLAYNSLKLIGVAKEKGLQGLVSFVKTTLAGLWLDAKDVEERLSLPFQLRFG